MNSGEAGLAWPAWDVPAAAVGAWLALQAAVAAEHAGRRRTPCEQAPGRWWPERVTTRAGAADLEAAVQGCGWCPVRRQCLVYALAAGEQHGVWGGLTPAQRREQSGA